MKLLEILFFTMLAIGTIHVAIAKESAGEKIQTSTNNAKRSIKRDVHKIEESLCHKDKADCLGKQIKNRATELKDATVDGVKDLKNKLD